MNITDSSYIKEISENNDLLIKKILNFTYINGKKDIESDLKLYNAYNILNLIAIILNIIIIIFIHFNNNHRFLNINASSEKKLLFTIFIFIFEIIIFIVVILKFFLVKKLFNSIDKFYYETKRVFLVKIPSKNLDEVNELNSFSLYNLYFIFIIFIYLCFIWGLLC